MKLRIRHIITLIIASVISFVANADMSHVAPCFSDGHIVDYQYDAAGKRLGAYYLLASDDVFNDGIGVEGGGVSIQELVREWSGEFVYENGELERILTDNGYWKNGRYWFYIKDWQGNNRVTVGGISDASATSSGGMLNNPTLLQAKDVNVYYPYGTRFSDVFATTTDRYQYSGKEFDRMNGLDLYDFHARQYDPVLGRFTTPDPLSEKYYHISPYAYCASNPLRYIDPTGKDITVLNYGHGTNQHLALLIQNKESQWEYYSFNGTSFYNTTKGLVGGLLYNNLGEKSFDSPQSFLKSSYNSDGSVSEENKGNINGYGFTEGYVIKTSPEQDSKIRQGFIDAVNEGYDIVVNHCAHAVQKALISGGINVNGNSWLPSSIFNDIINQNPHGKYLKTQP